MLFFYVPSPNSSIIPRHQTSSLNNKLKLRHQLHLSTSNFSSRRYNQAILQTVNLLNNIMPSISTLCIAALAACAALIQAFAISVPSQKSAVTSEVKWIGELGNGPAVTLHDSFQSSFLHLLAPHID